MAKHKPLPGVTLYGMWANGYTKTEAKERAGDLLKNLVLRVEEGPRIFKIHGRLVFVWPEKTSWAMKVVDPEGEPQVGGTVWGASVGAPSLGDAVRDGVMHSSQLAWSHEVRSDREFAQQAIEQAGRSLPASMHAETLGDMLRHFGWHRDYRHLRDLGATDKEAHDHAGRHDGWMPGKVIEPKE